MNRSLLRRYMKKKLQKRIPLLNQTATTLLDKDFLYGSMLRRATLFTFL